MTRRRPRIPDNASSSAPLEDESDAFREAVRGATPIIAPPRISRHEAPPPIPVQSLMDEYSALEESISAPVSLDESMESGEELNFLRPGLQRGILRKLRGGHWVVQGSIDLHGANRQQAREMLVAFLHDSRRKQIRCLRIVHGKGLRSPGREPVLRGMIRGWLERRDEILAYCQAPDNQGGSGATLVLIKAG